MKIDPIKKEIVIDQPVNALMFFDILNNNSMFSGTKAQWKILPVNYREEKKD